jgi:tetratricopeptide (TPR) repeat protein
MSIEDPLLGSVIGGCQVLDVVGRGGMGVIYKARQLSLDRIVAVKVLSPKLANDVNFVSRFQREARAIARVNHPNILAVYNVGTEKDTYYMIMELIEGESLAEIQIRSGKPFPVAEASRYVRQAALGLEAAHASGLLHRDVKPENLMLTKKGTIKVSDFGLAKEVDSTTTTTDAVMGTPAFMSPEQCEGRKVTQRSDIYSLGGSLYRLLTGRLPFEADSAMSMMYRHKHEALVPPCELMPTIPKAISDVIVKMMHKKPEDRYASMAEVTAAIDEALAGAEREKAPAQAEGIRVAVAPQVGPLLTPLPTPVALPPRPTPEPLPRAPAAPATPPRRPATDAFGRPASPPAGQSDRLPTVGLHETGRAGRGAAQSTAGPLSPPGFLATPSEDPYALTRQGDELAARGDRLGALKAYRQALTVGGLDGATQERLEGELQTEVASRRQAGESLMQRGMLVEAGREFRILSELDPSDQGIKGIVKEIDKKLAAKRTLINDIRTAIGAGQFERAISLWDEAPRDIHDESLSKQIEHLRTVLVPSFKLCDQGERYTGEGRLDEALGSFQEALRIDDNCERARHGVAEVQAKLNRIENMLKEGYELSIRQDYEKAIEAWRPVLRLRPGHTQATKSIVDASQALAQERRAQGDLKGALKALATAREIDPENRTVSRVHDELAELSEKEQALIDRAAQAAAAGRAGEAIRYWEEVRRINPANRSVQSQIHALSAARAKRTLKYLAIAFGVVALSFGAYQYVLEIMALREVRQAERNRDYEAALRRLEDGSFIFYGNEIPPLKKKLEIGRWRTRADRLQAAGCLADAVEELKKVVELESGDNVLQVELRILALRVQDHQIKAENALQKQDWALARAEYGRISEMARDPKAKGEVSRQIAAADRAIDAIGKVEAALLHQKESRRAEAIQSFKAAQAFDLLKAFADQKLRELGYDPAAAQTYLQAALNALREPWRPEAVGEAVTALRRADVADPTAARLEVLQRYAYDMRNCAAQGMVLVNTWKPEETGTAWGATDRREAFCIDRYEYPNQAGAAPQAGASWLEAKALCEKDGKQLCTWRQWHAACRAKEASIWTFGSELIPDACNWDLGSAKPSGSFPKCHNQIGAFDMNGNLAEWTLDGDRAGNAFQAGGHYSSGAQAARCLDLDRLSAPQDQGGPQVGFRCCKPLEGQ